MINKLKYLFRQFNISGDPVSYRQIPVGHINTTFHVILDNDGAFSGYVVQMINSEVFSDPEGLMRNFEDLSCRAALLHNARGS